MTDFGVLFAVQSVAKRLFYDDLPVTTGQRRKTPVLARERQLLPYNAKALALPWRTGSQRYRSSAIICYGAVAGCVRLRCEFLRACVCDYIIIKNILVGISI
jgi:hypothetical protein